MLIGKKFIIREGKNINLLEKWELKESEDEGIYVKSKKLWKYKE